MRLLRGDPYVKALGGLVLVSTVALTLADYVFKSTVAQHDPGRELGTFFASFYMILNLLALAAQLAADGLAAARCSACTARCGCCPRSSSWAPRASRSAAGCSPRSC